ncbi:nuclear transport factor 2 family protein [Paenarthrobacter sp. Z7-10]|uniref:nuclear transport factor 2 family protein n=1 Tax=Paenarthrobacter sp. Z7-10 TaxID=2787635 RepID=UPI0022A9CE1D|nr:nuclear transport factor 2 family protein [Paenarthrobacter sp. Z7-10]MCZ2404650.1 nuclear transport factor 2 family protein [Paenarthrobacter sp. Z7-10]
MERIAPSSTDALKVVQRLLESTNRHDPAALAGCFAADYVNETPLHPARGFTGREQVHSNWVQIFAAVPDLAARLLATAVDGDRIWSEWQMEGVRQDGSQHELAGIIVFTVREDCITAARFFLEPVDHRSGTVSEAVRRQLEGAPRS